MCFSTGIHGRELRPKVHASCFYSYYAYFIIQCIYTGIPLNCFHIHSLILSYFFYGLLNSNLQYSLLICLNSYFYLFHKREFKHENQ